MAWWKKKSDPGEERSASPRAPEIAQENSESVPSFPTRRAAREARAAAESAESTESSAAFLGAMAQSEFSTLLHPLSGSAQERQSRWEALGEVTRLPPRTSSTLLPAAPGDHHGVAISFLAVSLSAERTLLTTDGLGDPHPSADAPRGIDTELFLAGEVSPAAVSRALEASDLAAAQPRLPESAGVEVLWQLGALRGLAHLLLEAGVDLAPRLATYGAMTLPISGVDAPADWLNDSGELGLLVGLPHPLVPASFRFDDRSLNLIGAAPLRPAELKHVQGHGEAARRKLATALVSLGPARLAAPDRPSLIPYPRATPALPLSQD